MTLDYAYEKTGLSIHELARSQQADLRKRIHDVCIGEFMRASGDRDFTGPARELYDLVMARLTREAAIADEGTLQATLNKMDQDEARRIIDAMVAVCEAVAVSYYQLNGHDHLAALAGYELS